MVMAEHALGGLFQRHLCCDVSSFAGFLEVLTASTTKAMLIGVLPD